MHQPPDAPDGPDTDAVTIPVVQERLDVGRRQRQTQQGLRVRKEVVHEPVRIEADSFVETVEVERVPVGRVVPEAPPVRQEGDVTIVPVLQERAVVTMQLVLVEELRLIRRRERRTATASTTLRKEIVHVERFSDGAHADPAAGRPTDNPTDQPTNQPSKDPHMHTVIGAFDNQAQAQRAIEKLVTDGFDRSDVHLEQGGPMEGSTTGTSGSSSSTATGSEPGGKGGGFFSWLFGDDDTHASHRSTYTEAVNRGSSVVVVDAETEEQAHHAAACLHEAGAFDVDERAQQWRAQGWAGSGAQGAATGSTRAATGAAGSMRDDAPPVGKEGVLDVVQEELQVGKRERAAGGVRVIQRVSEKPVREVLRLREEQAYVDRRPVDRAATAGDLGAFKEGTLEVRETVEEPVVAKTARVVEEVRVGKQVREREEVIEDTVRRKDVEVQRLERDTPERAVASGGRDDPATGSGTTRDPETGGTLGDTRRGR